MMSMDSPERVYINRWGGERYWKSPAECPVEGDVEYIRADLVGGLCKVTKELLFVIKVHGFAGPKVDAVEAALAAVEG